jgi:hypothetical protein
MNLKRSIATVLNKWETFFWHLGVVSIEEKDTDTGIS